MKKPVLAFISLAIGIFLLLEGSRLVSGSIVVDLVMLVIGAILTISYLPLIGRHLEKKFKAKASITFMPMLAILGAGLLWQAAFRILSSLDKTVFAAVGLALLAGSSFFIYRVVKSR